MAAVMENRENKENKEIRTMGKFNNASFRLYKGKKTGDGAASSWQLSVKPGRKNANINETNLFLEIAPQTGRDENDNHTFDWRKYNEEDKRWSAAKSVSVKLGLPDIGEFLTVLNGLSKSVGNGKGLYHDTDRSNTIIYFSKATDKDGVEFGYNVRLSHKDKETSDQNSVSHFISFAEGEVLRTLFNSAILQITKWEIN